MGADRNRVWDVYVIRKYEDFLDDHPGDLAVLESFATFLTTCPRTKARDPKRAASLASELVKAVRREGDPKYLARTLALLASAHAEAGDFKAAVASQEEAVRICPKGDRDLLWQLERKLSRYRSVLERE